MVRNHQSKNRPDQLVNEFKETNEFQVIQDRNQKAKLEFKEFKKDP